MARKTDVSRRVGNLSSFEFVLKENMQIVNRNQYDEHHNKEGIINLSTSHNEAVRDNITEKLNQPDLLRWDNSMLPYNLELKGSMCLRKAICDCLSNPHIHKVSEPLDTEKMYVMNGVTSILNMMSFVLCDHGDTILTPSPMYGAIPRDFLFQSGVKTYPVYLSGKAEPDGREPFELTTSLLESALKSATAEGHNVRVLLLVNPFNPLGTVYTKKQVLEYLTFCKRHDLHCVIDEIYVASIFDESVESSSIFTFHPDELPDKYKTHVLWGTAKDFGMPGTPVGIAYSWNPTVLDGIGNVSDFYVVPRFIQTALAKLLQDKEWLSSYLPTNNKMLMESSRIVMETFEELGVPFVKPSAGLFIWGDFRKFIPNATKEAEMKFTRHCLDNRVVVAPGQAFYYNEFGWFRLIHSLPKHTLIEAMNRLKAACLSFHD